MAFNRAVKKDARDFLRSTVKPRPKLAFIVHRTLPHKISILLFVDTYMKGNKYV